MNPKYLLRELLLSARLGAGPGDRLRLGLGCISSRFPRLALNGRQRITLRYLGQTYTIAARDNGADARCIVAILMKGEYDAPGIDWSSVHTIIDAGANIGASSILFHSRTTNARILAVEPDEANLELLRQNVETLNPIAQVVPRALWPSEGEVELAVAASSVSHSVVNTTAVLTRVSRTVRTVGVPALMRQLGVTEVDLIKVDIEGAEKSLFDAPDLGSWVRSVRYFLIETHSQFGFGSSPQEIRDTLEPHGFTVEVYDPANGLVSAHRKPAGAPRA